MRKAVLPPSTHAVGVSFAQREPLVPIAWPGTYVPNFSDWREGDIVLVHRSADVAGLGIQASQAASLSPVTRAGKACTHASIYVGDGMVIDTTLSAGVAAQSVWSYCQTRALQVRRMTDASIPAADIADISVEAKRHVGKPYSLLQVIMSKLSKASKQSGYSAVDKLFITYSLGGRNT